MSAERRRARRPRVAGMSSATALRQWGRRESVRRFLIALLPAVALIVIAVGPALVGQRIFLAGDLIEQASPWRESSEISRVQNACVHDTIDSAMPSQLAFRDRVAGGEWPDFEPRTSGGHMLGAAPAVGTSSPLFLATLPFSDTTFTAWLKVFEILTVVTGMVLWARRIGLSGAAGAVGGFLYATSGFLLMWTNWPQTRTAVFFPLVFWAVERIVQERTWRSVLPLPLVVAAMALGGFPAIVVHTVYAVVLYALVRLILTNRQARRGVPAPRVGAGATRAAGGTGVRGLWRRWLSAPVLAGVGGVVAIGLVAVQVVPWAVQLGSQDLAFRDTWWSRTIEPGWLATLPFAQGLGTCVSFSRWWGGPTIPVEAVSFVGAGALVLIFAAMALRTRVAAGVRGVLLAVGLTTLVVTFVGGPFNEVLHHLPGMGNSFMARSRAVGGLCFAMLAAIGLDAIVRGPSPAGRRRVVALAGALGLPVILTVTAVVLGVIAPSNLGWTYVAPSVYVSVVSAWLVGGAWALVLTTRAQRLAASRLVLAVLATVSVTAEGVIAARYWWPLAPVDTFYRDTTTSAYLRENLGDQRMMGMIGTYHASATTIHDLRSLSGHNFVPPDWATLVQQADAEAVPEKTGTMVWLTDLTALNDPVMERFSVRYALANNTTAAAGLQLGWRERDLSRVTTREALRTVDASTIRGVILHIADSDITGVRRTCAPDARISAEIRGADGEVLATGERDLRPREEGIAYLPMDPVPEDLRAQQAQVTARVTGCEGLRLQATTPLTEPIVLDEDEPRAWVGVIVDGGDGLNQVPPAISPDALLYENPDALPRFRWAAAGEECSDIEDCALAMGRVDDSTVLLFSPSAAEVSFAGLPASIDVVRDDGDEQIVQVRADGAGMLVIADSVQPGWTAQVDGQPATLHTVDGAMRGIAVPAGQHEVRLVYEPVGRAVLGPVAIGTAALWLVGAVLLPARRRTV